MKQILFILLSIAIALIILMPLVLYAFFASEYYAGFIALFYLFVGVIIGKYADAFERWENKMFNE